MRELVDLKFYFTRIIHTETSCGNKQFINVDEIRHNERFVNVLMMILFLWDLPQKDTLLYERMGCWGDKEAIQKSLELFLDMNPELKKEIKNDAYDSIYFFDIGIVGAIADSRFKSPAYTRTHGIRALVY